MISRETHKFYSVRDPAASSLENLRRLHKALLKVGATNLGSAVGSGKLAAASNVHPNTVRKLIRDVQRPGFVQVLSGDNPIRFYFDVMNFPDDTYPDKYGPVRQRNDVVSRVLIDMSESEPVTVMSSAAATQVVETVRNAGVAAAKCNKTHYGFADKVNVADAQQVALKIGSSLEIDFLADLGRYKGFIDRLVSSYERLAQLDSGS